MSRSVEDAKIPMKNYFYKKDDLIAAEDGTVATVLDRLDYSPECYRVAFRSKRTGKMVIEYWTLTYGSFVPNVIKSNH